MPRNTTGGKNFKKFKTGSEGFRAVAARQAADEMLDIIHMMDSKPKEKMTDEELDSTKTMLVGRVLRKFGHGRLEVSCSDNTMRQCRIRGLLRKKGQVFIDVNTLVVVSLREADEESDDEEGLNNKGGNIDGTADIVGVFNDKQEAALRKTNVNKNIL